VVGGEWCKQPPRFINGLLFEEIIMAKDTGLRVRPLDDRVVVEPLEAEEKTAGGILLPDTAKQKPQRGRVLAVGPGKMLEDGQRAKVSVGKGDEVLYGRYSGTDIQVDQKEIKIMRESDILAKVVK
jgi:chaperonin GroES